MVLFSLLWTPGPTDYCSSCFAHSATWRFSRGLSTWLRDGLAHHRLGFGRAEIEELLQDAGLVPRIYLERGRNPGAPQRRSAARQGRELPWPDVFLVVAEKPATP